MFAVVFQGMYIFITSPHISFLTPFFFDNLSFSSNFRYKYLVLQDRWTWLTKYPVVLDRKRIVSAAQRNLCDQATTEFVGYIHNLSPLKKGSYFDCQLQGKEKTVQGVCFSPPKLKRFTSLSEANSTVKIKKFHIDTKSNAEDFLMGHDVTIEHFPAIDFDKVKLPTMMNLSTIKSVCPGQIVTVSKTVGSKNLQIQEAIIADPSGTMKMTLWENFVGSIKQGDMYTFRDICVYKDKMSQEICLNTTKSGSSV